MTDFFIDKQNYGNGFRITTVGGWFARALPKMESTDAEAFVALTKDFIIIQNYLTALFDRAARNDLVVELPEEVKNILCQYQSEGKTPKRRGTARRSSTKSQSKPKETGSSSSSSPKQAS